MPSGCAGDDGCVSTSVSLDRPTPSSLWHRRWVVRAASSSPTDIPPGSVPAHRPADTRYESNLSAPRSIAESSRSVQESDSFESKVIYTARRRRTNQGVLGCYDASMRLAFDPFRLLLISLAGWLNQRQQDVIDYLQEENRVLREQLGDKRLRFNDEQRRRLAVRAKKLGWRMLHDVTRIVTPATLLAWHP